MESPVLESGKFQKANAVVGFGRLRRISRLRPIARVAVGILLVSWLLAVLPAVFRIAGGFVVRLCNFLLNHHVVFVIGNSIVMFLLAISYQSHAGDVKVEVDVDAAAVECYDDYLKEPAIPSPLNTEAAAEDDRCDGVEEKVIVCMENAYDSAVPKRDDVAAAIENAERQIQKFLRTQSGELKKEISVRPADEIWMWQTTEKCRRKTTAALYETEIDSLSNEEFRRAIDEFIDKNWINKELKTDEFAKLDSRKLQKVA